MINLLHDFKAPKLWEFWYIFLLMSRNAGFLSPEFPSVVVPLALQSYYILRLSLSRSFSFSLSLSLFLFLFLFLSLLQKIAFYATVPDSEDVSLTSEVMFYLLSCSVVCIPLFSCDSIIPEPGNEQTLNPYVLPALRMPYSNPKPKSHTLSGFSTR